MKIKNSILVLRGKLGNVVFKKYSYGTVITAYTDMSKAGCSINQRRQRSRFKQAVNWAKNELSNPETKSYYENLPGKGSALNKAVAAFLKRGDLDSCAKSQDHDGNPKSLITLDKAQPSA